MNSIVIGTDGSSRARAAVSEGLELAARVEAEVTFVSVRDPISLLRHEHEHDARAAIGALDDALAEAERRGVPAVAEGAEGDARAEILRVAHRAGADLIVIGSSAGEPGGRSAVASELPRHSQIPVLVVGS